MTDSAFPVGQVVLKVPARTEFVSLVRLVVASVAEIGPDMAVDRVEDLRVAVSEAATNAIEAQVETGSTAQIGVRCSISAREVVVSIHDEGGGFDPDNLSELPDPGSPERLEYESGLGVYLMRALADETEISSTSEGTDVRLVVYSSKRSPTN